MPAQLREAHKTATARAASQAPNPDLLAAPSQCTTTEPGDTAIRPAFQKLNPELFKQ